MSENTGSPPLADALCAAAGAWVRLRAGTSLERALELSLASAPMPRHPRLAAAAKDLAYTATRQLALIDALIERLAPRPPAAPVAALLAVALGQLLAARHADYTIVDQAVRAAKAGADTRAASGFVNALLRRVLRERDALLAQAQMRDEVRFNAPRWWIDRVRAAYADAVDTAEAIFEAQRVPPPLTLRVNRRQATVDAYLARLQAAGIAAVQVGVHAVWLREARPVDAIPGFDAGDVSVQDAGAQLAAEWLDVRDGMRVLDACAAPGGKTAQLAELADLELDAVEIDAQRAARIDANLERTGARRHSRIRVIIADAAAPRSFAPSDGYDRILLDAPCTASGIVRRHPDIPWLRRAADVAQLATLQASLADALWSVLAPAGRLLYVVCSIFPEEGVRQVERFGARWPGARAVPLPGGLGTSVQLLPSAMKARHPFRGPGLPTVHDGFFFALFEKT